MRRTSKILYTLVAALAMSTLTAGLTATPGFAAGPALKVWLEMPGTAPAGESIAINVTVENVGNAPTSGPITVTQRIIGDAAPVEGIDVFPGASCEAAGAVTTCTTSAAAPPGAQFHSAYETRIASAASGSVIDDVTVSGGGSAGSKSVEKALTVGAPDPFDFVSSGAELTSLAGTPLTQAASVPAEFTTKLYFKTYGAKLLGTPVTSNVAHFKDVAVALPPGLIGNPTAVPTCSAEQLSTLDRNSLHSTGVLCPAESQVGVVRIIGGLAEGNQLMALYNMVAPPGAATELGFNDLGVVVTLDAYVRSGDSGITVVSRDTSTTVPINGVEVTAWGVPAASSHDPYRGLCIANGFLEGPNGGTCPSTAPVQKSFLRMPTSCSGSPLQFNGTSNSYENRNNYVETNFTTPALTGCDLVPFSPEITVFPTGTAANSPTGVSVRLSLPQNSNPEGLGEADLKKAVVTLPEGMAINPSAADGLQACTDAQLKLGEAGPAECPEASKIGTLMLHTPLLTEPIEGNVYLRTQNSSDPESGEMFRIAMELRNDERGIDIKVPGYISVNKNTGRLTTTFDNNPQLPFEDITLSFKAGARAPLVTPATCQTQTTEAQLYSWAEPNVPVHRSNSFTLTSGAEGTSCPPPSRFNPGFNAGVSSVQAGGFTSFLSTFSRSDADQSMQRVSVKLPLGLSGSLSSVALCGEAQANAGSCGPESQIGTVTAGAGAGPTPFYVTGGKVFMTGPYEGAPFGLSVVVPAKAGPFDLGTVVVRAKVEVDPNTAQLTITTDPLPQIVSGVPVNLRLVNVTVDRQNFTFNPTDCNPTTVTGSITGGEGAVAQVSNHFQVTNCGALAFEPKFAVSTSGKPSRANGASLDAKLTYPSGQNTQANIARVKVSLPKQLPSRLTTLQKACTQATFSANPAACPAASRIGMATATTPILPVPLAGPVYFVSRGGEAFPNLVVVLQGYGVTIDLVGNTFISKAGITSTTFKTVPDVPVGTFELKLPEGPYSALAANGKLCGKKLTMPTEFLAQNGTVINRSTPISVSGCPKQKVIKRAHKTTKRTLKHAHKSRAVKQ
jgi:hypothetical protein